MYGDHHIGIAWHYPGKTVFPGHTRNRIGAHDCSSLHRACIAYHVLNTELGERQSHEDPRASRIR